MCYISLNVLILYHYKIKISIIKIPEDSLFIFLVLKAVFITVYLFKLVKTTSPQKLFPSGCIKLNDIFRYGFKKIFFPISNILSTLHQSFPSYSVTQSYANGLCGDVVLASFNIVSRDEDNILDQI